MTRTAPADVVPQLAEAARAVEAHRWAEAAAALLAAWRDCRCERIARAVAAVDLRLPAPAPLEGKLVRDREAHWHALVQHGDDDGLRRALAAPWPAHPRQAHARLDALRPLVSARISNALLALHRSVQYTSTSGVRLSRAIFHLLVEQDDHAVVAELERCEQQPYEAYRLGRAVFRRRRPLAPVLVPSAEAALARIEQLLAAEERAGGGHRHNLLAAIYAAPHDDAPRVVYADVLTEAGDPRGELITLQLAPTRDLRREARLLRAAGRAWFDGLDADGATEIVHARGFPAAAALASGVVRAPAWATIEKLFLRRDCAFAGAPHLRALRELHGLRAKELATVRLPVYELDVLAVRDYPDALAVDTPLAPRVLGLDRPAQLDRYVATVRALRSLPIARRLEAVRVGTSIGQLRAMLALTEETGFTVELTGGLDLDRVYQWAARVTPTALHLRWAGSGPYGHVAFEDVARVFANLPAPQVEVLEVTGEAPGADRVRADLRRMVERWPRLRSAQILGLDITSTN